MFLNTELRCPVMLLLDTSTSMEPFIADVNAGLQTLRADLASDHLACQRVEIGVVTFGPVRFAQDFITVDQWVPPKLFASGNTPLGEALQVGLRELRIRKDAYREAGIPYYRPWIWMVTDGAPTDDWKMGCDLVQSEIVRGGLELFSIGTDNADFNVLASISYPRPPIHLRGAKYRDMFLWLSQSLKPVSRGVPSSSIPLRPEIDWGEAGR